MDTNVPDRGDIAISDIDGAKKESDTERKGIEFKDENGDEKPSPAGSNSVNEGKNNDYDKVNKEVNDGSKGRRDDNDVFREADFANEVTASDDGLDTLRGAFGKKTPKSGAG